MRTVKEVSELTGVSIRALHHYDAIGLLKPTKVTRAGYRLYDDKALRRLQTILLFRELQFSLKQIKAILDDPNFDPAQALCQQIKMLELQYKRIGELIDLARRIRSKGVDVMNFDAFDTKEIRAHKAEVMEKWGNTKAYQQYEQKNVSVNKQSELATSLMLKFVELGKLKHLAPKQTEVQVKIKALQQFITDNYYECTPEILSSLGEMYINDERFRQNIDKAGGKGTAEFVNQAILVYCSY
ncbi:MerR family transcriptional regulator [Ligilactobacillus animalis]|uniref:MerR family transcriptional regulator n=1 Tax=Ligilactobacillus animalis TaxID=1605 RepID=UPI00259310CE|nr:MerR family transcriptional regulator [Ligilactobacillus animalis]